MKPSRQKVEQCERKWNKKYYDTMHCICDLMFRTFQEIFTEDNLSYKMYISL